MGVVQVQNDAGETRYWHEESGQFVEPDTPTAPTAVKSKDIPAASTSQGIYAPGRFLGDVEPLPGIVPYPTMPNALGSVVKAGENVGRGLWDVTKTAASMVAHPMKTAADVGQIVSQPGYTAQGVAQTAMDAPSHLWNFLKTAGPTEIAGAGLTPLMGQAAGGIPAAVRGKILNAGFAAGAKSQVAGEILHNIAPAVEGQVATPSKALYDVLKAMPGEAATPLPRTFLKLQKVLGEEEAARGTPTTRQTGAAPWVENFQQSVPVTEPGKVPLVPPSEHLIEYTKGLRDEITKSPDLQVNMNTLRATVSQLQEHMDQSGISDRLRGAYRGIYKEMWDDMREGTSRTSNPQLQALTGAMKAYHTEQTAQRLAEVLEKSGFGKPRPDGYQVVNPPAALRALQADRWLMQDLQRIGVRDDVVAAINRAGKYTAGGTPKVGLPGQLAGAERAAIGGMAATAAGASFPVSAAAGALAATFHHGMAWLLMSPGGRAMIQQAMEGGGAGVIAPRVAIAASLAGRTQLHRAFEVPATVEQKMSPLGYRQPAQAPPDAVVLDLSKPRTGAQP